jgi:hypothetical protein
MQKDSLDMVKTCTCCGEVKDIELFYTRRGKARSECKSCTLAVNKATITKDAKLKGQRKYREGNREQLNKKNQEYKKSNRAICNASWMKYHASKLNATPTWLTKQQLEEIQTVYVLAKECELLSGDKYHVDHIIPLQGKGVCGLHVPWNLQVLPADINISKGNR